LTTKPRRQANRYTPRVPLLPILAVNFIGTLGYSIVMPFLVFLVAKFGGNAVVYGILGATYSAFQLVGAPILGKYSDRVGRKKVLLLSQIGTLIAWLMFLLALLLPNLPLRAVDAEWLGQFTLSLPLIVLFLGRALDGLTGGNISVANAYLVDISSPQDRKRNFGKMAASSNLGFIIGPALAGLLGATALGEIAPTLAAILISGVAVIVIVKMLPEHRPESITASPCRSERFRRMLGKEIKDCYDPQASRSEFMQILRIDNMWLMLALYFMIFLAFNVFYTAFPVHAANGLQWDISRLGIFFAFLSAMMIVVQGPVLSLIGDRVSESVLVIAGSAGMVASFLLLQSPVLWSVYLAAFFFALGNGVMWPSFLSILGTFGNDTQQGYIQGISSSAGSLASIIGLVLGGLLYTAVGTDAFLIAAAIFGLVLVSSIVLKVRLAPASPGNRGEPGP
jgi:MFS family permease